MSHIFISYSRKDQKCVHEIADRLTREDFPTWIDMESLEITAVFLERIETAINSASVFMLFWSKNAKESDYVKHELNIAKNLQITGKLDFLVVMLDDTPLPLPHIQAYDLKHGCTAPSITAFINTLKPEWKQFSRTKPLNAQTHKLATEGGDWVSVLYDHNATCRAYIVGRPAGTLPKAPKNLAVCLQFFRGMDDDMLMPVFPTLPDDAWILHITGPVQVQGTQRTFRLDDHNPAQWEACREFIVRMIQSVGSPPTTVLHFYALTPNALMGGVTMPLNRFWHVKLYNFIPNSSTYVQALDLPRF